MTECIAVDLESLKSEIADALELAKDSFNISYAWKGKQVVVRTQGNFKIMVSKPPNTEGSFEVVCEMKDQKSPKPVSTPDVEEKKPTPQPVKEAPKPQLAKEVPTPQPVKSEPKPQPVREGPAPIPAKDLENLSERAKKLHRQIDTERAQGKLSHGSLENIVVMGRVGNYVGEHVPGKGAHGHGKFTCPDNTVEGLFFDGQANGFCIKI